MPWGTGRITVICSITWKRVCFAKFMSSAPQRKGPDREVIRQTWGGVALQGAPRPLGCAGRGPAEPLRAPPAASPATAHDGRHDLRRDGGGDADGRHATLRHDAGRSI